MIKNTKNEANAKGFDTVYLLMKILLLGGTGAIGTHLVDVLEKRGDEVFVTSRKDRENRKNVTFLTGNAKNTSFINPILKNNFWDAIVDFMTYGSEEFNQQVDYLLSATKQYVFLSSSRVYENSDKLINEESPRLLDVSNDEVFIETDDYALYKARQEDILLKHPLNNKCLIIRPYITYSEFRLPLGILEKENWLYRALQGRSIVFSKDVYSKLTTLTYGLDVSNVIVQLIGKSKANGLKINIVSSKSEKWSDVLELYLEELGRILRKPPKFILIEETPTAISLGFSFKIKYIIKSILLSLNIFRGKNDIVPNYQLKYDRLFNRTFDNSKIFYYVDDLYFADYQIQLRECLRMFIEDQRFMSVDWKVEALHDHLAGEFTPLNEIKIFKDKILYILIRYFIPLKFLK